MTTARNEPRVAMERPSTGRQVGVLVLTANEALHETLTQSIRRGYTLHRTETVNEAEELVRSGLFGVLITDMAVAEDDVIDLTYRLGAHAPSLVFIIVGDRDHGHDLVDLVNSGRIYRFLLKPISPGQTRLTVQAAMRQHFVLRRKPKPPPEPPQTKTLAVEPEDESDLSSAFTDALESVLEGHERRRNLLLAVAAGVTALVIGLTLFFWGSDDSDIEQVTQAPSVSTPAPTEAPAQESGGGIEQLLQKGEQALESGRIVAPENDSALGYFNAVIAEDPANARANDGLNRVTEILLSRAEQALSNDEFEEAVAIVQRVRSIQPNHPGIEPVDALIHAHGEAWLAREEQEAAAETADAAPPPPQRTETAERADATPAREPAETRQAAAETPPRETRPAPEPTPAQPAEPAPAQQAQAQTPTSPAPARQPAAPPSAPADGSEPRTATAQAPSPQSPAQAASREQPQPAAAPARRPEPAAPVEATPPPAPQAPAETQPTGRERLATTAPPPRTSPGPAGAPGVSSSTTDLSRLANARMDEGRLLAPAGDSAKFYVQALGRADPSGEVPRRDRARLAALMLEQARVAMTNEQLDVAERWLTEAKALEAEPLADTPGAPAAPTLGGGSAGRSQSAGVAGGGAAQVPSAASAPTRLQDEPIPVSELEFRKYVEPKYPRGAYLRGVDGWVDVAFTVDRRGRTTDIQILDADPPDKFDDAAYDAVKQWEFRPHETDGDAAETRAKVRVRFKID